jgi:hypothetical protein
MINLDDETLFIGSGSRRHCYHHPDDPNLCIKITPEDRQRQQNREARYYRRMARRGASMKHVAKYHGRVNTSRGPGHIYDLVLDPDGSISKSLTDYLNEEKPSREELVRLIVDLKDHLLKERIMFYDLNGNNVLCQEKADGSLHFMFIDGLGEIVALAFLNVFRAWFLRTFNRRWVRVVRRFHRRHPWTTEYSFDSQDS